MVGRHGRMHDFVVSREGAGVVKAARTLAGYEVNGYCEISAGCFFSLFAVREVATILVHITYKQCNSCCSEIFVVTHHCVFHLRFCFSFTTPLFFWEEGPAQRA